MEKIKPIIDVRLRVGIGAAVIATGIVLIILFYLFPGYREVLRFSGAVLGSMAAIFSAYYVAESMRIKIISDQEQREFETKQRNKKKKAAALKYSFTDDPQITPIILRLHEHLKINSRDHGEIPLSDFKQFPNDEYKEFHADITMILGRLEVMCIAMKNDLICKETCIDLLLSRNVLYYELFKQYIKAKQKEIGPDIYENFEATAVEWQSIRNARYGSQNA